MRGLQGSGSPTKSHGRERYPDPVPTDRTTAVQPPDQRRMLVRIQLGGLWPSSSSQDAWLCPRRRGCDSLRSPCTSRGSCHVTRSVSRADCLSAERGSTPLRGASCMREPGVHGELQPRAARVRVPAHAPRTRPQSGRPSSKRTGWGARPYACTRSRPVDPDRRLLSDAARCNPAAGYQVRGSLLLRSRVFHTRPRVRFPPRARFSGR